MLPAWRDLRTATACYGLNGAERAVSWYRCHLPKRRPLPGLIYSVSPSAVTRDCERSGWKLDTIGS